MEVIRESLRVTASTKRKEHRMNVINKKRAALGETIENLSYTTKFVVEMAHRLKKKTLETKDYRHLQNALIQAEENVNAFFQVPNILYALTRDLSGNNPIAQLAAASCCCNLALGNASACTALAKCISPYLIAEMESLNYPLLDVCIWTIGNLINGSRQAFQILYMQDCMKYLILLLEDCDDDMLPSVTYAALHCVYVGFHYIQKTEMIELAQIFNKRNLLRQNANNIWLLALLSSIVECAQYFYSAVPTIVDYLHSSVSDEFLNSSQVTAYIRILANVLSNSSEEVVNIFLKNPKYSDSDLQAALNKLLLHSHYHVRKETLWLIGNLYNHASTNVNQTAWSIVSHLSPLQQAVLLKT